MKRHLISLFLLAMSAIGLKAQQTVTITLTDGTKQTYETWEVKDITFSPTSPIDTPAVAEAVDLGLSVKWASFNFGAETQEDAGYLIGWGDVTGKNYSTDDSYFPVAEPTSGIIGGSYDIAASMWGGEWRMPSADEVQELIDSCTWVYDETKACYTITSKINGNSIFLPFTGFRSGKNEAEESNTKGYYWTGSLGVSNTTKAIALMVDAASPSSIEMERHLGYAIRPVYGKYLYGAEVLSMETSNISSTGCTVTVTFNGDYANATEFGICYSADKSSLTADNGTVMTVTSVADNGTHSFNLTGLSPNTTYYFMAYVVYNGNRNESEASSFTTIKKFPEAEAIDLGLSVKWASWNMGASSVYDYGSYIGWGDPTGENTSFSNTDYPNDIDDIAGTEYDVAHVQWGGKWRMPTSAELQELDNLTKVIETINGIKCYRLTADNGNELIIPLNGYENKKGYVDVGNKAYYWASELVSMDNASSCTFGVVENTIEPSAKGLHMPVRPVYDETLGEDPTTPDEDETEEGKKASESLVDLGLSVKWASYNIGATSETQQGDLISWGETEPKSTYTKDTYNFYSNGTYTSIGSDIKGTEYDAANVRWGGTWRMPTYSEWQELIDNCTWTWSESKQGYTVTSSTNGKSIFLYAGGYCTDQQWYEGSLGYYWSSAADERPIHADDHWSYYVTFASSYQLISSTYRYFGCCVRPVKP